MRMYLSLDEANTIACLIELHKARGQLDARQQAIYKRIKALMHRHFSTSKVHTSPEMKRIWSIANHEQTKDQTEDERGDFR